MLECPLSRRFRTAKGPRNRNPILDVRLQWVAKITHPTSAELLEQYRVGKQPERSTATRRHAAAMIGNMRMRIDRLAHQESPRGR
jgi:hypothetical protein